MTSTCTICATRPQASRLNAGVPLAAIGALLGHGVNSATMTARYSHLADRALADAAALVGDRLAWLKAAQPAGHA